MNIEGFDKKYREIVKKYDKVIQWELNEFNIEPTDKIEHCVYKKTVGIIDWYKFGDEYVIVSNDEIQCVVDINGVPHSVEEYFKDCESYFVDVEKEMMASVR